MISDLDSVTVRVATKNAMTPTGRLRKKTDCQPRCSTMSPPTVGPRARANAEVPAHSPIAFARSCGGNVTVMIDSVPGRSSAAPAPCSARAAISCPVDCESPQNADAIVKTVSPSKKIFLRP